MPEQKRIQYGGRTLDLPAGMSLEEAKQQMARFFPELSEPKVETKKDGDTTTYVFSKQAGRKGAGKAWRCPLCGERRKSQELDGYCLNCWLTLRVKRETPAARKAAKQAARKAQA